MEISWSGSVPTANECSACERTEARYVASAYLSTAQPVKKAAAQNTSGQSGAAASGNSDSAVSGTEVGLSANYKYAEFSKINSGKAILYKSTAASRKNKTVCVNAGHGTKGGSSVKTLCHPDGTPKVTGGTTGARRLRRLRFPAE